MPDNKYVSHNDYYFPGTLIKANILFDENDLKNEQK